MSEGCLYFLDIDGNKLLFTPEGSKYFYECDELLKYISDKCGKDVADCFKLEQIEEVYTIFESNSFIEYQELAEEYEFLKKTGKFKSPIAELKFLRRVFKKFTKLVEDYTTIYRNFY